MLLPKLPPPVLEWSSDTLPRRRVRGRAAGISATPVDQPFDFCAHIQRLAEEVIRHCPDFQHIDPSRVMCTMTQAQSNRAHGLHARVTPMRFCGGELIARIGRHHYQVQRFVLDGREVLYVIDFCLPRFLNLSFDEKFVTLFHELYHIGPAFDGDLRRHHGRCHVHSHSKKKYDEHMGHYVQAYLNNGADPELHAFLRLSFAQLRQRHGSVVGITVPRPKIIPVPSPTEY